MVPVEMRAFGLLAICVLVLAAVLFVQALPQRPVPWPVSLVACVVVAVLAIIVLVTTGRP